MPDEWANAFAPTIALLGCTTMPVIEATIREGAMISLVLILVSAPKYSRRWRSAITISSIAQFPARSPMPFTVHST